MQNKKPLLQRLHHVLHRTRGKRRARHPAQFHTGCGRRRRDGQRHRREVEIGDSPHDLHAERHPDHGTAREHPRNHVRPGRGDQRERQTARADRRAGRPGRFAAGAGIPLGGRQRMALCAGDARAAALPGDHRADVRHHPLAAPFDPRGAHARQTERLVSAHHRPTP